ncbi:MAG: hypothetical protein SVV67_08510 [Bacillota bacterium]|nr:hypothetical protein [Bacillota bacterium]
MNNLDFALQVVVLGFLVVLSILLLLYVILLLLNRLQFLLHKSQEPLIVEGEQNKIITVAVISAVYRYMQMEDNIYNLQSLRITCQPLINNSRMNWRMERHKELLNNEVRLNQSRRGKPNENF